MSIVTPTNSWGHPALATLFNFKYAPEMEWLATLVPVLVMGLGGAIGWFVKSHIEELRGIEEQLREQRRKVYSDILNPYILLFSDLSAQGSERAISTITSQEYRKTSFELNLVGSDEVVRAYNDLMQYSFKSEAAGTQDAGTMMRHWGMLLLEIRKSLGNKETNLDEFDMLRGMIKDMESIEQRN